MLFIHVKFLLISVYFEITIQIITDSCTPVSPPASTNTCHLRAVTDFMYVT